MEMKLKDNNQTDLFDSNGVFLDSSTIIVIDIVIETSSSLITSLVTDSFIYTTYEGSVDDTLKVASNEKD